RTDPRPWPRQEGDLRLAGEQPGRAARPRARPAARGRPERGLSRRRHRLQGKAQTAVQGQVNKQALAERIAGVIEREDRASRFLGMRLDEVKPGAARMSMRVTEDMVNGQH